MVSPLVLALVVGGFLIFAVRVDLPFTLADILAEARRLAGGVKHQTVAAMMGLTSQELSNCLAPGDTRQARTRQRHLSIQRLAVMTTHRNPDGKKVFTFFCYLLSKRLGVDELLESAAMVGRTMDQLQVRMARAELRDDERKVS